MDATLAKTVGDAIAVIGLLLAVLAVIAVRKPRWLAPYGMFTVGFLVVSQAVGLMTSPPEMGMGNLQKIMYVHLPAAWTSMVAFFIVFVASILYLWRRQERHDLVAAAAAEAGVVLLSLALGMGMIWGKPTWGVWWTWDPRLTSTAVMLLIYVGYLALRAFTDDDERRARWSAAAGILAFINVPIVYMSVRWWRTLHQPQSTPATVDPMYVISMRLNAYAYLFLMLFFIAVLYRTAQARRAASAILEERALMEDTANV